MSIEFHADDDDDSFILLTSFSVQSPLPVLMLAIMVRLKKWVEKQATFCLGQIPNNNNMVCPHPMKRGIYVQSHKFLGI